MRALEIKDIGQIGTEFVVFGGPYSNLQATEALFSACDALGLGPDQRVCTGDGVAYCGDPAGVAAMLDGACHWVAGNCEKQLASGAADCGCGFEQGTACDMWSAQWYGLAAQALDSAARARMAACPDVLVFRSGDQRCVALHGGVTEVAAYFWPCDADAVFQRELDQLSALVGPVDIVFAGHTGLAFERVINDVRWINAGVIGMPPHDGRPQTRYVHFKEGRSLVKNLSYDVVAAQRAMRAGGYPEPYATALETGKWPSEDILPHQMRRG